LDKKVTANPKYSNVKGVINTNNSSSGGPKSKFIAVKILCRRPAYREEESRKIQTNKVFNSSEPPETKRQRRRVNLLARKRRWNGFRLSGGGTERPVCGLGGEEGQPVECLSAHRSLASDCDHLRHRDDWHNGEHVVLAAGFEGGRRVQSLANQRVSELPCAQYCARQDDP